MSTPCKPCKTNPTSLTSICLPACLPACLYSHACLPACLPACVAPRVIYRDHSMELLCTKPSRGHEKREKALLSPRSGSRKVRYWFKPHSRRASKVIEYPSCNRSRRRRRQAFTHNFSLSRSQAGAKDSMKRKNQFIPSYETYLSLESYWPGTSIL